MQVKSIVEFSKGEHSAILSTFIQLPFVIKIFVLSIFELSLKTCFNVVEKLTKSRQRIDGLKNRHLSQGTRIVHLPESHSCGTIS